MLQKNDGTIVWKRDDAIMNLFPPLIKKKLYFLAKKEIYSLTCSLLFFFILDYTVFTYLLIKQAVKIRYIVLSTKALNAGLLLFVKGIRMQALRL